LEEPAAGKSGLKKIWEYECIPDGGHAKKESAGGGGNVIELPDTSLFVSMGGSFCKIFIVDEAKEVLWCAVPEEWVAGEKKWEVAPQYRASIIENKEALEKLIWNQETDK